MIISVAFRNIHIDDIISATVTYTGEQWRRESGQYNTTLSFSYALDDTLSLTICCNNETTWTPVNGLDFVSYVFLSCFRDC